MKKQKTLYALCYVDKTNSRACGLISSIEGIYENKKQCEQEAKKLNAQLDPYEYHCYEVKEVNLYK